MIPHPPRKIGDRIGSRPCHTPLLSRSSSATPTSSSTSRSGADAGSSPATSCGSSPTSRPSRSTWSCTARSGAPAGTRSAAISPDDDAVLQPLARLLRARERRAARLLPGRLHARADRRRSTTRSACISDADMHALEGVDPARIMRTGARDEAGDRVAHREGERRRLQLDARPLRDAGDGRRGRALRGGVLAADHRRLLPRRGRTRSRAGARSAPRSATTSQRLNALPIERLHVVGEDVDLRITLGEQRQWVGGSGRNIPSFEIFTSPDWRGTEGWIAFNQPLYRYGNLVRGRAAGVRRRARRQGLRRAERAPDHARWSRPRTPTRWGSSR